jgi:tripeptide aminopeptidase
VTAPLAAATVSELERRYLNGTFAELCRIESPSGREHACAQRVIAELRALDISVHEDDAGTQLGSDCGNLLARIPAGDRSGAPDQAGAEAPSVLLCAHLDTVPQQAPIEPVLSDGHWQNANAGILGADNKAAIAVLLTLARHISQQCSPVNVELLFTVGEETALAGARAFDTSSLRSPFGYVFDHATPIGELVLASPTHFRLQASFHGAAAHAGIRPEDGRSAILAAARAITSLQLGRLDEHATVNVGTITGGTAMNVVPEHCSLVLEARALGEQRADVLVADIVDRIHQAANLADCDCDVDIAVQRSCSGYELSANSPAVAAAERALRACGHEPIRIASGGASDANALYAQGLQTVNIANGTERNHEPGERVSAIALEQMLDVTLALLHEVAALAPGAAL